MTYKNRLHFSFGNSKLSKYIAIFSLPSGHTCPGAKYCLSKANKNTGKIVDGKNIQFRCYKANIEAIYSSVREKIWQNFELLKGKTKEEMIDIISDSLPNCLVIRIDEGGDFFSQNYFDAWLEIAKRNRNILFYSYTKSLPFWIARIKEIPSNFVLTASYGGKYDNLIKLYNLRHVKVFDTVQDAQKEKYRIDIDDSLARNKSIKKVGLLLHGNGPVKSIQAKLHKSRSSKIILAKINKDANV